MSEHKLVEAQNALRDALQNLAQVIGPRACAHGDFAECDDCTYDDTQPMGQPLMLSEVVAVMAWTGMENGENYFGLMTGPNQLLSHTNGLLFTGLYE